MGKHRRWVSYLLPLALHLKSTSWLVWLNQAKKSSQLMLLFFSLPLSLCSSTSYSTSPFSGWWAQSGACNIYAALPFGKSLAANAIALSPCCLCPSLCTITCCWNPKESCFEGPRGAGRGLPSSPPLLRHPSV